MKPEIFWQFANAVNGMGEACRVLGTPVTGGNVSFYNENAKGAVFPTPVIGMIGLIEPPQQIVRTGWQVEGDEILLIGPGATTLGGSQYLNGQSQQPIGPCPSVDLNLHKRLIEALLEANQQGLLHSAQDVAEGGLAVALSECCLASELGLGAEVKLPGNTRADIEMFSEEPSRVLISSSPRDADVAEKIFSRAGLPVSRLGKVHRNNLRIEGVGKWTVDQLTKAYETAPF